MPAKFGAIAKAGSSADGFLKPDAYATGTHYCDPLDRRGYREALCVLLAGTNGSSGTVDTLVQQSTQSDLVNDLGLDQDTSLVLRNGATDNTELAWSFTTPNNGGVTVTQIQARVKAVGTLAASKQITVTIQADSSDSPDDTDLVTPVAANKAPDEIGTSAFETITFDLSASPVHLDANTKYWVVFEGDYTVSASNHIVFGIDTVASGGNTQIHDSDWGSTVSTQTGHVAVTGYDWANITSAAFTQVTESNDNAARFGMIDLEGAAGTHLRTKTTVATAACDTGNMILLLGATTAPSGQSYDFEV